MLSLFLRFIIWQVALTGRIMPRPPYPPTGIADSTRRATRGTGGATAIVAMLLGDVLLINVIVEGLNLNALFQLLWAYLSTTQDCLNARVQVHNLLRRVPLPAHIKIVVCQIRPSARLCQYSSSYTPS